MIELFFCLKSDDVFQYHPLDHAESLLPLKTHSPYILGRMPVDSFQRVVREQVA